MMLDSKFTRESEDLYAKQISAGASHVFHNTKRQEHPFINAAGRIPYMTERKRIESLTARAAFLLTVPKISLGRSVLHASNPLRFLFPTTSGARILYLGDNHEAIYLRLVYIN